MEILVDSASAMNVTMCRVRAPPGITINPFQPVLGSVGRCEILEIIGSWDALRFRSTQEVVLDWVCVVAERYFDWSLESMKVSVVAGTLRRKY